MLAGAAVIAVAASVAYLPSLKGGFILDDDVLLTDSPLITAADGIYRFWFTTEPVDYWPVSNTSLWLEWRLWGMHPSGYRVTNLILHIVTACLIGVILRRLFVPGAFLAALLFAVHPVNVDSVAWIAQRKSLLAMLFSLLAVLSYLKSEEPPSSGRVSSFSSRWYWLSLLGFLFALLSKVSAAILPALLVGTVWWMRPLAWRDLVRTAPFFLIALALVGVNLWFRTHSLDIATETGGVAERLLGAAMVVWFYLYKACVPINLAFIYPRWHIHADQLRWWLPLMAMVVVTGVLWRYRQGWGRPLLFAWGCFCVAVVPAMGFTEQLVVADHYQHVALISVVALTAAGWSRWQQHTQGVARWVATAAAVGVTSVLGLLTWQQAARYADWVTLCRVTAEQNPDSSTAHHNLGFALLRSGRPWEAIDQFEQALRLEPDYGDAHRNLGAALGETHQFTAAIEHLRQALRLRPDQPDVHNDLGAMLRETGRPWEAVQSLEQALRLKPNFPEAHCNLGKALLQLSRRAEAIEHLRRAVQLKPEYADAHLALGAALSEAGQLADAIDQFQQAVQLRPDDRDAQQRLDQVRTIQQKAAESEK